MSKVLFSFCGIFICFCLVVVKFWLLVKFIRCNVCVILFEILVGSIKIFSYNFVFGDFGIF